MLSGVQGALLGIGETSSPEQVAPSEQLATTKAPPSEQRMECPQEEVHRDAEVVQAQGDLEREDMLQRCKQTAMGCAAVTSTVQAPDEAMDILQRAAQILEESRQSQLPQSRDNEGAAKRRAARSRAHSAPQVTQRRQSARAKHERKLQAARIRLKRRIDLMRSDVPSTEQNALQQATPANAPMPEQAEASSETPASLEGDHVSQAASNEGQGATASDGFELVVASASFSASDVERLSQEAVKDMYVRAAQLSEVP